MDFFTSADFELSQNIDYNIEVIDGETIVYLDNIYKNPDRVVEYLDSCPILSHRTYRADVTNGLDFYDGRHTITESYDQSWNNIHGLVGAIMGINPIEWTNRCSFNMTTFNCSSKGHWFPHQDPGLINGLVYLNKCNNYGAGTSFYKPFKYKGKGEHIDPWCDYVEESHCILDRFNCGVFFSGDIYHAMRVVGDTFVNKRRYTEVHFLARIAQR